MTSSMTRGQICWTNLRGPVRRDGLLSLLDCNDKYAGTVSVMRNCKQVAVYEHRAWSGYLLPAILPGAHRITVCIGEGSEDVLWRLPTSCNLFVFHINLTLSARVPFDRNRLVNDLQERDIIVLNAQVSDISKRAIQGICAGLGLASATAQLEGDPNELVVVKTTYNYHGISESRLTVQQRSMLGYESPNDMPPRSEADYRIMRRSEVPAEVWNSPHWVVERYVANTAHRFHRVYLAGDAMVVSRVFDPSTFKKMPEGIVRESYYMRLSEAYRPPTAPSEIGSVAALSVRIAHAARVEYGAFDVVSDDHRGLYLIDINTTPYWGDGGHPDLLAYLGAGLLGHRYGT
jgi:hypothetical protein